MIDAQGSDLQVLRGATQSLPAVDGVYIEVSEAPLYEGGCTLDEITGFLKGFDLRLRWLRLDGAGHGEAFYCRPKSGAISMPDYDGAVSGVSRRRRAACASGPTSTPRTGRRGGLDGPLTGRPGFHTDIEDAPWWQGGFGGSTRPKRGAGLQPDGLRSGTFADAAGTPVK